MQELSEKKTIARKETPEEEFIRRYQELCQETGLQLAARLVNEHLGPAFLIKAEMIVQPLSQNAVLNMNGERGA